MPTDAYTRVVLTTMALSLLWLCAMTTPSRVRAQGAAFGVGGAVQPVVIVGWGTVDEDGRVHVMRSGDRSRGTTDPHLPVKVIGLPRGPVDVRLEYTEGRPMPVGVTSIKAVGEWAPIRSAVEPEPVRPRPGAR